MRTLKSIGQIRPKLSSEIKASPWGVNFSSPQVQDWTPILQRTVELGVKWARISISWGGVEKERGIYDWSRPDQVVDYLKSNGVEVYANTGLGNEAWLGSARGIPPMRDPAAFAAWKKWLAAAGERYKDRVIYWEMANEPNIRTFWMPEPDAVEYAQFVIEGAKILRAANPHCKICAGVTAGIPLDWIREFLAAGTVPYFDVFVYHAYRTVPEGYNNVLTIRAQTDINQVRFTFDKRDIQSLDFFKEYQEMERLLRKRGFTGPIWQGETGYPSTEDTIHWRGDGPWGPIIQAKFVLRRLLTDWFAGAEMSSYFLMLEFSSILDPRLAWGFHPKGKNTKGLLVLEDLSPKPAYFTLQRLCSALAEVKRAAQAAYQLDILEFGSLPGDLAAKEVLAYTFAFPSGRKGFVYWVPKGMSETWQPGAVTVQLEAGAFAEIQKPVLVDLLQDAVYPVSGAAAGPWLTFEALPLTDYPLVLADQADIPLK